VSLNPIKKLASQTVVYGLSSILGRFLNYLLVWLYTREFTKAAYGVSAEFYAYSGFLGVLLVFGFETGFFRFSQDKEQKEKVYSTALNFVLLANMLFLVLITLFINPLADKLRYANHHEYFYWFALILALDSIAAIPFARLRSENKALQFAGIKFAEIGIIIILNLFFIGLCKHAHQNSPGSFFGKLYNPEIGIGYIFIANLVGSAFKFLFLLPQLRGIFGGMDKEIFRQMFWYSLPMVVIGFAGIINEMLDRAILKFYLPFDNQTNMEQIGIYSACYKLSIVMSLFIQAFRFAAEPFFFSHAREKDSREIYAQVMKYFVIVCSSIFLLVMLYLDIFKHFIGQDFRVGLPVVPILLMANLCLGVYVNLSIWYKLTDRTALGAMVSIGGALLTLVLNIVFIPQYGYMASAWATLACYGSMAVVSYILGQKYFPVQYDLGSFFRYISLALLFYFSFVYLNEHVVFVQQLPRFTLSSIFMLVFLLIAWFQDGRALIGRAASTS
jgi:O-antigen/teichoic acid export membrane protein